ncbi:MAG: hypothetical protein SH809_20525 [Rhodothermales bacterium]|nr:hypothetical protein [Rhodothermales bacterium]
MKTSKKSRPAPAAVPAHTPPSYAKHPATPLQPNNWWVMALLISFLLLGLLMVGGIVYSLLPGW